MRVGDVSAMMKWDYEVLSGDHSPRVAKVGRGWSNVGVEPFSAISSKRLRYYTQPRLKSPELQKNAKKNEQKR